MDFHLITPAELSPDHFQRWKEILRENPYLQSPYFHPEFVQTVSQLRSDIEIVLMEEAGKIVGFFPFHRKQSNCGHPVAGRLSGFEGLITPVDLQIDLQALFKAARLKTWQFDQLPSNQHGFESFVDQTVASHYIDLSSGFDHYLEQLKTKGSRRINKLGQLERKLIREQGPLRFELHHDQPEMLDLMIQWKSEQFARTHFTDVFQVDWTKQLLKQLFTSADPALRGQLSVLWIEDQPLAMLYSLQSHQTLHGWFTVYNHKFSKYSPGSLVILKIAEAAAEQGISRFDLGPGDQLFKETLSSGADTVCSGEISFDRFRRFRHQTYLQAHNWLKHSRFQKTSETIFNTLRPLKGWLDMH